MAESTLLPELVAVSAARTPDAIALTSGAASMTYGQLHDAMSGLGSGLLALGLQRGERVAIYLEKRFETVIASFAAPSAGAVFVPINPLLKPEQVSFILQDCNVRVLVTSPERLALLLPVLGDCPDLRHVVVTDVAPASTPGPSTLTMTPWQQALMV